MHNIIIYYSIIHHILYMYSVSVAYFLQIIIELHLKNIH